MAKNIVLIGMMGCGKTTVGRLLSRRLGLELADTDALIEAREGRSIPEIFASDGEAYFRALELELCRELAGREGLVIACGGGLPLQDEAIAALKQNGLVFWLDRDPGESYYGLDVSGRPLAQGGREDFLARYSVRSPIYHRWADFIIVKPETPQYAENRISTIYMEVSEA
ncbi:MAG: shikimate kinase [Oscillospiraceae bacterium]|jgi:shikimate kinase|nr:shikimate kinase [Oscillospiraceae bacterium]